MSYSSKIDPFLFLIFKFRDFGDSEYLIWWRILKLKTLIYLTNSSCKLWVSSQHYYYNCNLGYLSRSSDDELDQYIFQLFDLTSSKQISLEEMQMMLINLPDIGFSNSQNILEPDRFYTNIKNSVLTCISKVNQNDGLLNN